VGGGRWDAWDDAWLEIGSCVAAGSKLDCSRSASVSVLGRSDSMVQLVEY